MNTLLNDLCALPLMMILLSCLRLKEGRKGELWFCRGDGRRFEELRNVVLTAVMLGRDGITCGGGD